MVHFLKMNAYSLCCCTQTGGAKTGAKAGGGTGGILMNTSIITVVKIYRLYMKSVPLLHLNRRSTNNRRRSGSVGGCWEEFQPSRKFVATHMLGYRAKGSICLAKLPDFQKRYRKSMQNGGS
jgi:hypothetical protein